MTLVLLPPIIARGEPNRRGSGSRAAVISALASGLLYPSHPTLVHLRPSARHRVPTMSALIATSVAAILVAVPVSAADPIRIGLSLSLTGPSSPAGKQVLAGLEIWRDDVNAKGGLLGRPMQLVHYGHAFLTSV